MHRTQLFLPKPIHEELKAEAQERKISISELVREIIDEYLHKHDRKTAEEGIRTLLSMADNDG